MAVKKLYTESWIADIADALRTVIGGTDTYNTREMAATLATIHRGAKDVWIGTQFAYNQIPASQIDVEICYIILESGQVIRCYAGSTIIYDVPVVWDYTLPTTVITPGQNIYPQIDGQDIVIAKSSDEAILADAWEWYLDAEFGPGILTQSLADFFYSSLVCTPRWQSSHDAYGFQIISERGRGQQGIDNTLIPVPSSSATSIPCRFHATKNANEGVYMYMINDDDSETFIGSTSAFDSYPNDRSMHFGGNNSQVGNYTINEFKFRWKT